MKLEYKSPGLEYSIDSIMLFHNDTQNEFWTDSLFYFYPQIDKNKFKELTPDKRVDYLKAVLKDIIQLKELEKKKIEYQDYWNTKSSSIQEALEQSFAIPLSDHFNNMTANITLNPVCPRFLERNSFDVFYLNSAKGALGIALHEIIHFVWFLVWNTHFKDNKNEYETPHLKWIFSEMVIDPIMRHDERLYSINPYFEQGCAYDYFYSMKIDSTPILETMLYFYQNNSIINFMEIGYNYCLKHENEIRKQIR